MITTTKTKLYRADFYEPLAKWNTNSKSPLPRFENKVLGHKNQNGLFFLTDSLLAANDYGVRESIELNFLGKGRQQYYLTRLDEEIELAVIDFSSCKELYEMIDLLYSIEIDVLTGEFKVFSEAEYEESFGDYKTLYESIKMETDSVKIEELKKELLGILGGAKGSHLKLELEVPVFGQRLSDFSNGEAFRRLVKAKYPTVDGYKWREGIDGFTFGLFDSKKLSGVSKTIVPVNTQEYLMENNLLG